MRNIEYIDNDASKGIRVDWKLVRKELKKLNIPTGFYNPSVEPLDSCKYFINLSERSTGKTTGWLLLGLVLYKLYGIQIQYIRSKDEMVAPKQIKDLMSVITNPEYHYIEKLTEGKYTSCYYHARRWYYCNRDESGIVIEQDSDYFMICLTIDKSDTLKSSYTNPKADFIIFDEFIGKFYNPNEFVYFMDLLKTILRDRLSGIIVCCANTINKQSPYFQEFGIKKEVTTLQLGESKTITTDKGTRICLHWVDGSKRSKQKLLNNSLFFGFNNTKLNSITGGDWAIETVQHIDRDNSRDVLLNNYYLLHNEELLHLQLCDSEKLGIHICVTNATRIYEDSVVFTIGNIEDRRYKYGTGVWKIEKYIWKLYQRNKFYYSTNEVGEIVADYVHNIRHRF